MDSSIPKLSIVNEAAEIDISIPNTQAILEDQSYSYNQANFSYNQASVFYGGIYNFNQDIVPLSLSIGNSQALLSDSGYTYNQSSFSYDQSSVAYGGVYNYNEDIVPIRVNTISDLLNFTLSSMDASVYNQNYTYNQSGYSYDQAGAAYGGIYYYNEDIIPMTLIFEDLYTKLPPPTPGQNQSVGPGWFLFITH